MFTMKKSICFLLLILSVTSCKHVRKIPYTQTEIQKETLSFTQETAYWQRKDGFPGVSFPKLVGYGYMTNTSTHDGTFKMHFVFSSQGAQLDVVTTEYVKAGERKLLSVVHDINHYTFQTNVAMKTRVEAPTLDVEKVMTKYREEEYYALFETN